MEIELTPKRITRTHREIARLSTCIFESNCIDCMHSLAHMINMLTAVLAERKTIEQFLEHLAESDAGPKIMQWYLDMYEV
jgi:CBS domain containing-hemolysin-like protein